MIRRILALTLALGLAFGPVTPSLAGQLPVNPLGGSNGGGDETSAAGLQDGQSQDQNDQNFRAGVNRAMSAQGGDEGPSFGRLPTYSEEIARDGAFTAQVQIDNDNGQNEPVTLLFAFNDIFTGVTHEIYKAVQVDGNGEAFDVTLSNTQLNQNGVGPGRYRVAFVAFDRNDQRLGDGFYGNSFTRGEIEPTFTGAPSYARVIGASGVFAGTFNVGNTGDTADRVTLVTVITPAGTNNSKEFSRAVNVAPGGGAFGMEMTAQELRDAGIGLGDHVISFLVFNGAGEKVGDGFYGNPFSFGSANATSGQAPAYSDSIAGNEDFTAQWTFGNDGAVTAPVSLLTVFTRAGTDASIEIYKEGGVPPGGGKANVLITNTELDAAGIGEGEYILSFVAFDPNGNRIGQYFGNLLAIGDPATGSSQAPSYTNAIGVNESFSSTWTLANGGPVSGPVTLLTVITPLGTENSVEFYRTGRVPPGGGQVNAEITNADLDAAGFTGGRFLVTFAAFDENDNRIGQYFGNLLTIGTIDPTFNLLPTYDSQIGASDPFVSTWTLGNTGDAPDRVNLVTAITRAGTENTVEFSQIVDLAAGGGAFDVNIAAQRLRDAGIGTGDYLVTFAAYNGVGELIGQGFFGNVLAIGTPEVTSGAAPVYSGRIGAGDDFTAQWDLGNSGPVTGAVSLLTVFTKVGTNNSIEVYRNGEIPPGGGKANVLITAAELAAAGITPGDYTLSFVAFDANDTRIGQYFGNPLFIGDPGTTAPQAPSYTNAIGLNDPFAASWTLGNGGPVSGAVTLLTVLTPLGTEDSVEFYTTGTVPPGGGQVVAQITHSQLDAAGIRAGRYLASFVAFDENDNRIAAFFGNLVTVGNIDPSLGALPGYDNTIGLADPFVSSWQLGNAGDAPDRVTLVAAVTRAGTENTVEFSRIVDLPAGGAAFDLTVAAQQLRDAGIGEGDYLVTFVAYNGVGQVIGQPFYGNLLSIGSPETGASSAPIYSDRIGTAADFTAQWDITNSGPVLGKVTLLTVITRAGTNNSIEFYRPGEIPPGGGKANVLITDAELDAAGIGAGDYVVSFVLFNEQDERIGEYFGNTLRIGDAQPAFSQAPAYDPTIGANYPFTAAYAVGNTASVSGVVTLLAVFTAPGTENSIEMSRDVTVPPGGGFFDLTFTAAELRAAGVNIGRQLVTFLVLDAEGNRVGTPFYGNPLTIGSTQPSVGGLPAYDDTIPLSTGFSSSWSLGNAGDAPDKVTLLTVITPLGGGDSDSREFYKTVDLAAGGGAFNFNITAAELAAAGITGGRYLVTFAAYDGAGAVVGTPFYGNRLDVGDMEPAFGALPDYTDSLDDSAAFQATFNLGNTGDASDRATLITVITPLGTQNSKEFYRLVTLPPGGGAFGMEMTAQELRDAGIGTGEFLVTFLVLNGWGERVGTGFFGNRLSIGNAEVTSGQAPAYSNAIDDDDDFTAQWTLGNGGPVAGDVSLLAVFTRAGTNNSIEIYRDGRVAPGGGTVNILLTAAELAAAGITPGDYTLSFVAFDPDGNRIGEFFGNPFARGSPETSIAQAPTYWGSLLQGADLTTHWSLGNAGSVGGPVVLLTVITPVGTTNSHEFYRTVQIPSGGSLVDVTLTAAELAAAGFGPGEYLISFAAFNQSDVKIGEFLGNRLDIIESGTPEAFLIAQQIANNGMAGILETWDVPAGDPMEGQLADRAFTYDEAVSVIALIRSGHPEAARKILEGLQRLENGTGLLGFVYATGPRGEDFMSSFTGTLSWVGLAAVMYEQATGDNQFRGLATRLAEKILSFVDPATGLLKGGQDADGNAISWISTEHNLDAFFFLHELGRVTGNGTYTAAADALEAAILANLWTGSHFNQGFQDDLVMLDVQALGGLFLLATGRRAEAEGLRTFIEDTLAVDVNVGGQTVYGYAPYRDDNFIWTEGTMMVALFDRRLGDAASADALTQGMAAFQDAIGGLQYASPAGQTTAPGQTTFYPDLSHVGATAWLLMQSQNARGLFTPDVENVFNILPVYADPIGRDGDFTSSFTVAHEGAPGALTLVTAITPVGGGASREFSSGVTGVPPSKAFNVTLTDAQLDAAGIAPGRYLVTFLVIDADGNRVGQPFFGNPLTRGTIGLDFDVQPTSPPEVPPGGGFDSNFDIGNSGDTADTVTLTLVFTPVGTTNSVETSKKFSVNPGGGRFLFGLSSQDLAGLNITPGFYTIRFLAHDGFGDSISDSFFSALVEFLMG